MSQQAFFDAVALLVSDRGSGASYHLPKTRSSPDNDSVEDYPSPNAIEMTAFFNSVIERRIQQSGQRRDRIGSAVVDGHRYDLLCNARLLAPICLAPKCELRPSPHGGRGLFLTTFVAKDEIVTFFPPDCIGVFKKSDPCSSSIVVSPALRAKFGTTRDALGPEIDKCLDYQFTIGEELFIRGHPVMDDMPQALAHFANDGCANPVTMPGEEYLAHMEEYSNCYHHYAGLVCLVAKTDLAAGTELTVAYGPTYWSDFRRQLANPGANDQKTVRTTVSSQQPIRNKHKRPETTLQEQKLPASHEYVGIELEEECTKEMHAVPCCSACGKFGTSLFHCSLCHEVMYCSYGCRNVSWPKHRDVCRRRMDTCQVCVLAEQGANELRSAQGRSGNAYCGESVGTTHFKKTNRGKSQKSQRFVRE